MLGGHRAARCKRLAHVRVPSAARGELSSGRSRGRGISERSPDP